MAEWAGSILGLLGAFLLATNSRFSRWGWMAFLGANLAMISFALQIQAHGLLLQQLGFTATSCLGWYRAGLWPVRQNHPSEVQ
jgi:nicotinamide riboside transporter PnuC